MVSLFLSVSLLCGLKTAKDVRSLRQNDNTTNGNLVYSAAIQIFTLPRRICFSPKRAGIELLHPHSSVYLLMSSKFIPVPCTHFKIRRE